MRAVVTGGRSYAGALQMFWAFDVYGVKEVAQGGATGADWLARNEAKRRNIPCETFVARWKQHGKAAGPMRNAKMLTEFKPDAVLAFPGGRGTEDCVRQARALGIPVIEVR